MSHYLTKMPKPTQRELEEELDLPDREDEALLRHIFEEDVTPPQGLHQQGHKPLDNEDEIR